MRALPVYRLLRPLLFRLDPERAHELALGALAVLGLAAPLLRPLAPRPDPRLGQELLGRWFPGPVGLAAGFDKDARAIAALPLLGFGFAEVGTVTAQPQEGNPRPRLRRYTAAASLQNAMGFNNAGVEALARRLRRVHPGPMPIGVNLGKGRETSLERAADDYAAVAERVADRCDFLVVNVSSPNTPGLRELESPRQLRSLLARLRGARLPPLLVKLSPDLAESEAAALGTAAAEAGAAGLVLTNTTVDYALLPGAGPPGGLSGAVLRERSFASLRAVARELAGRLLLVSVGGIDSGAEAYRRLRAGASLTELYTGLVYRGPGLARRLHRELVLHLERDGARSLREVIGANLGQ